MNTVPDFFQEESEAALLSQVQWLGSELSLGNVLLARFLRIEEASVDRWRSGSVSLPAQEQAALHELWDAVLHLLSFQHLETERVREMLEVTGEDAPEAAAFPFAPPWLNSSMKEYLETGGRAAAEGVTRWVTSFRFGDPYAVCAKGVSCPSTRR
jgi:hypothetical protein